VVCGGLVLLVVGTFLPWLWSGRVARNSYAAGGAARRLLGVGGWLDTALRAWSFIGVLAAVAIALVLLGRSRLGTALAALAAAAGGGTAAWVLTAAGNGFVRPATLGPVVTLTGSIMTTLGVLACASTAASCTSPGRGPR
jgi:hypothetical protein